MNANMVNIEGRKIPLSNLEKILYPDYGFTKAHILNYYRKIFPFILPHLKDRAVTLKRYPEGVQKDYFYEKRCPPHRPDWVQTADVSLESGGKGIMKACLVNDIQTLIWIENMASIELHVPQSRVHSPKRPDSMVFDLDPGEGMNILDCASVALILRDVLSSLKLISFVKTSGMKGLHVFVPLNRKYVTYEQTKTFSRKVAEALEMESPGKITSKMAKEHRRKRIFINWSQNDASKTMICVYSLRAREEPVVSFPLTWDELEHAVDIGNSHLDVMYSDALKRVEKHGDLFADMNKKEQSLPYLNHGLKRI